MRSSSATNTPDKEGSEAAFDVTPPHAASIVESLRAFGYDLSTAIADLVDNSISAGAKNVWVHFDWAGAESVISVTDDGKGMSASELVTAMRLGSQNPLAARSPRDLGRFGLGLKTASISQCRRLTVRSRRDSGQPVTRCWDLDTIAASNDWRLLHNASPAAEPHFEQVGRLKHGTAVLWQHLDRLTAEQNAQNATHQQRFLARIDDVRRHLGLVFHRLISDSGGVRLHVNEREVKAWDPFLEHHPATKPLPTEPLKFQNTRVVVRAFILPHRSKLSNAEYEAAAGPRGWLAHQGFYIYRQDRLLVAGDWLNFGWTKDEHLKLARIAIELPNALDHEWQIDVTKSKAIPPAALRDDLRRIAERAHAEAKGVFTFRGAKLTPHKATPRMLLWEPLAKHDKTSYRVNREHPLVRGAIATAGDRSALNALLRMLEETIPLQHISIESAERPDVHPMPFEGASEKQIRDVIAQTYDALRSAGHSAAEAKAKLQTLWPFELFPSLVASIED